MERNRNSEDNLLAQNHLLRQELYATRELLHAQSPHRNDYSTPPRRNTVSRTEGLHDYDDALVNQSPPLSVMKKLVLLSPKFIVDGLQQLRDITEASSLRFTDDLDDVDASSPTPQSPEE
eukprot:CAMPEP_0172175898 /NCGR_PEP_ID=MMETSP1050-20130122/14494_1 /TAXON_ID=233186 /ORGANISM="Cryptomonas curvata, Strain CCAP979/52" /LENGTH=119 /DNA_ID=CAMNT_0012848073 /DNA_START=295 /DNA_END=651 /DNA_ORIENTATION=-